MMLAKVIQLNSDLFDPNFVQDMNPMGVTFDGWTPDHPDPSDVLGGLCFL